MINFWIGLVLGLLIYHCANEISPGNIPFARRKHRPTIEKVKAGEYRYDPAVEIKGHLVTSTFTNTNTMTSKNKIGFFREAE